MTQFMPEWTVAPMPGCVSTTPIWLIRPRSDGGNDYVRFRPTPGARGELAAVEILEGSHLPPQMPLLRHRRRLDAAQAELCRRRLLQEAGYRRSEPLF